MVTPKSLKVRFLYQKCSVATTYTFCNTKVVVLSMTFDHYEDVPQETYEEIIKKNGRNAEMSSTILSNEHESAGYVSAS